MCDEDERAFSRSHSASALRSLSKQSSDPFRFTGLDAAPKMLSALRSTQTTKRDLSVIMHPIAKAEETAPGWDPWGRSEWPLNARTRQAPLGYNLRRLG